MLPCRAPGVCHPMVPVTLHAENGMATMGEHVGYRHCLRGTLWSRQGRPASPVASIYAGHFFFFPLFFAVALPPAAAAAPLLLPAPLLSPLPAALRAKRSGCLAQNSASFSSSCRPAGESTCVLIGWGLLIMAAAVQDAHTHTHARLSLPTLTCRHLGVDWCAILLAHLHADAAKRALMSRLYAPVARVELCL
jgi:hypothetical protein